MSKQQAEKGEEELKTKIFRQWKGVNTQSARNTLPEEAWFHLENLQPIGPGNIHTIDNLSSLLFDYAADPIYWSQYVNIQGIDYLLQFATTGRLFAYKIADGTQTLIKSGLAGSGTRVAQWKNTQALIVDSTGYYSWDGTTFTSQAGTGTGVPSNGTEIAVYSGIVWIVQGRLITFSAINSFDGASGAFDPSNGAGTLNLTDSQIRNNVVRLISQNGYLYIIAATAINVISDVYVPAGASPPVPNFTNLNIQAIIGTDQPGSVFPFNRALVFANRYGIWIISGVTAEKISIDIDGTWQYADFSQAVSGGMCVSNNILSSAVLMKRNDDPVFGSNTILCMYHDQKWWFSNYGALTLVTTAVFNNIPTLYGFIGNRMYRLFADTSSSPASLAMTALWGMDDPLADKQVIRAGFEAVLSQYVGTFTMTVDGVDNSSVAVTSNKVGNTLWQNNLNQTVGWVNNFSQLVQWFGGSYLLYDATSPGTYSKYVGATIASSGSSYQLSAVDMDYKLRARW